MPFVVTPTPTGVEELVLDGLALNDNVLGLEAVSFPPPRQRQEWIGAADSEAQLLVRNPLHENREITATIAVAPAADKDGALTRIGQIVDKLQAASAYMDGVELTWSPSGSSLTVTFDVLAGEVTDLPVDWESGWMVNAPTVTVTMRAKPYWRGTETLTGVTSGSGPVLTAEIVNLIGDVPALGRLIVTDAATQSRRHVEWGLEGPLTYNSATSLLIDSDSLVTAGFAGALATVTGAYDANAVGTNALTSSLYNFTTACCGTGTLAHVGTFRVKARVKVTAPSCWVRLAWQVGDGAFSTNQYVKPPGATSWYEIDLGVVTIPVALVGTQKWSGRIEAFTESASVETLTIDYLTLIPAQDGYGKTRTGFSYQPGVMAGYDGFTGTTAGVALNARAAPAGGSWATSGVAGDFTFADDLNGEQLKRNTADAAFARRLALLGTTSYGDVDTSVRFYVADAVSNVHVLHARYVDANNYLEASLQTGAFVDRDTLAIAATVGGLTVAFTNAETSPLAPGWYRLRLLAWQATGNAVAVLYTGQDVGIIQAALSATQLATAGAIATGKVGIADTAGSAVARYYDDFYVGAPAAEPAVIFSGRNMQVRYDDTVRQDATGTYTGRPPIYRGSRFLVDVGTSRVLVKARRNDVDMAEDPNVTDALQVQVGVTPRGLVVPRA
jgi:hypothetical protein